MEVGEIFTLVLGIVFSGGASSWVTTRINAKRSKVQNETDARGAFTSEFDSVVAGLTSQIDNLQEDIQYLRGEIGQLRNEVSEERRFTEFVRLGVENGTIPPWPDRYSVVQSQRN